MSQRQLAQQSGVDHSTISRLIRGDRMPSLGTATKLARGLRELRDDADTPQYLGLVASGATNPTARVEYALRADELLSEPQVRQIMEVLPGRPDAPLRSHVPAIRAHVQPSAGAPDCALCAGGPRPGRGGRRPGQRQPGQSVAGWGSVRPMGASRWAVPADPRRPAASPARRGRPHTSPGHGSDALHVRVGTGECRHLGCRHSHVCVAGRRLSRRSTPRRRWSCGPRSRICGPLAPVLGSALPSLAPAATAPALTRRSARSGGSLRLRAWARNRSA